MTSSVKCGPSHRSGTRLTFAGTPSSDTSDSSRRVLLGRSLQSLGNSTSPSVDAAQACRFLVEGLAGLRNVVVRTTFSGLTGDAGASNPERLLLATGKWKELLLASRDVYDTAFKYREMRRVAD